jgi:hypothetical protein
MWMSPFWLWVVVEVLNAGQGWPVRALLLYPYLAYFLHVFLKKEMPDQMKS